MKYATMAERLTNLREHNHLSQSDVAHRLKVSPALISAYESNERKPSLERLVALADIYHVSTDYILGRTLKNDASIIVDVSNLTETQIKIVQDLIINMNQIVIK